MTICHTCFSHPKAVRYNRHNHELVEGFAPTGSVQQLLPRCVSLKFIGGQLIGKPQKSVDEPKERVEVTSKVGKHKFVFHLVTEKVKVKINRDSLTNNVIILMVTLTRSGTCLVI